MFSPLPCYVFAIALLQLKLAPALLLRAVFQEQLASKTEEHLLLKL